MAIYTRFFKEISLKDVPLVGGKNASLGELYRQLIPRGVKVPNGFAITAEAYQVLIKESGLEKEIHDRLAGLDPRNSEDLAERGARIRQGILEAPLPPRLIEEIIFSYRNLIAGQKNASVAVRSSATAEDLPDASFAGQQETYLNVQGEAALIEACRKCFASLYTNRAISYRHDKGFDHMRVALSIGVQLMVRSDLASSGVIFTLDTESGFRDIVLITSSYGLGENVVQGVVNPDEFHVFKPTLRAGFRPIVEKKIGSKEIRMIYDARGGLKATSNVPVTRAERQRFSITDDEALTLARWAILIEDHYGRPMDIEWAKDGLSGDLFVLQARPETVHSASRAPVLESYALKETGKILATGTAIGSKIGQGPARLIRNPKDMAEFQDGEILVTEMTDPDWEPVMKKAAAIITERGGRTCHAAIVSRELGVPAVVGAENVLTRISAGQNLTVSCAEGAVGKIYEGLLKYETTRIEMTKMPRLPAKIMMNVARPDQAYFFASLPNDGVGLARLEFIIADAIRVHPVALARYPDLKDAGAVREIENLTHGWKNKADYFVDKLALGVGRIAAAFYPKDVIVRFSDFKSNEYANLVGGREFEPVEENPMLGFRGASRYYDPRYRDGFALECQALKRVRNEMGLVNVKVMIPFCRTVEEGQRVLAEMAKNGLKRGENGLEVYVMCEIPSNVILAEEFAAIFDGFSIGSNDLTQLILGLDRDSAIVSRLFDERNDAVKAMIRDVIRAAQKANVKIGICGQAPSDYPEFADFLLACGIDSISLNPDSVLRTIAHISPSPTVAALYASSPPQPRRPERLAENAKEPDESCCHSRSATGEKWFPPIKR